MTARRRRPTRPPDNPGAAPQIHASPVRECRFWHPAWPISPTCATARRRLAASVATSHYPQPHLSESGLVCSPSRTHHPPCQRQHRIPSVDSGLTIAVFGILCLTLTDFTFLWPPKFVCNCQFSFGFPGLDKFGHFGAFVVLGLLLNRGLTLCTQLPTVWCSVVTFTSGVCFGGLIEIVQPLVGRTCDIADLVSDALGVVLGIMLWVVFLCFVERNASPSCWLRRLI